jgi:hypothetical protein
MAVEASGPGDTVNIHSTTTAAVHAHDGIDPLSPITLWQEMAENSGTAQYQLKTALGKEKSSAPVFITRAVVPQVNDLSRALRSFAVVGLRVVATTGNPSEQAMDLLTRTEGSVRPALRAPLRAGAEVVAAGRAETRTTHAAGNEKLFQSGKAPSERKGGGDQDD